MSELIINKCYEVFFDRGQLKNPVIIKIKRIYKDINLWSNKEVDYIEAEAIDDNGIYYESINYPKNDVYKYIPMDDCVLYSPDIMKIKQIKFKSTTDVLAYAKMSVLVLLFSSAQLSVISVPPAFDGCVV